MNTKDIAEAFVEGAGVSGMHIILAIAIGFLMMALFFTGVLLSLAKEVKQNNGNRSDLIIPVFYIIIGTVLVLGFFVLLTI